MKVEKAAEWVAPQALVPWPDNPRSNDGAVEEVAKSIAAFGFGAPIVARRANREIIAGHTRHLAALRLRLVKVPVRYLDVSAEDAHRLALSDNKTGELATWDVEQLSALLGELGADLPGFDASLLEQLAAAPAAGRDVEEVEDVEEPVDASFVSEPGRTYQLGRHSLTFGSSLGVTDEAELLLFDPPFDVEYSAWRPASKTVVVVVWRRCDSAFRWVADRVDEGFGTHELVFTGGLRGQHNHTLPACMHENVTVLRKHWWSEKFEALDRETLALSGVRVVADGRHSSWQERSGGVLEAQSIGMAWAKPIPQMMIAMAYGPRGCAVFDPCAGSGSGLIAAERSGRTWRGYEIQGPWVDLIRRRWTKECAAAGQDPGPDQLSSPAVAAAEPGARRPRASRLARASARAVGSDP